jgi:hypothetical protein
MKVQEIVASPAGIHAAAVLGMTSSRNRCRRRARSRHRLSSFACGTLADVDDVASQEVAASNDAITSAIAAGSTLKTTARAWTRSRDALPRSASARKP